MKFCSSATPKNATIGDKSMNTEPKRTGGKTFRKGRRTGSVAKDKKPETTAAVPSGATGNQLKTTLTSINKE